MGVSFSWLKNSITACSLMLFDGWEQNPRFAQNTTHSTTHWIPRNSEQFRISTAWRSHHLHEIHAQWHYLGTAFVLPTMRISKFLWIWLAVSNDHIIILLPQLKMSPTITSCCQHFLQVVQMCSDLSQHHYLLIFYLEWIQTSVCLLERVIFYLMMLSFARII